jgi:hypothetical protein
LPSPVCRLQPRPAFPQGGHRDIFALRPGSWACIPSSVSASFAYRLEIKACATAAAAWRCWRRPRRNSADGSLNSAMSGMGAKAEVRDLPETTLMTKNGVSHVGRYSAPAGALDISISAVNLIGASVGSTSRNSNLVRACQSLPMRNRAFSTCLQRPWDARSGLFGLLHAVP